MSQNVVNCRDVCCKLSWRFFPVPFPPSPFGFRRFGNADSQPSVLGVILFEIGTFPLRMSAPSRWYLQQTLERMISKRQNRNPPCKSLLPLTWKKAQHVSLSPSPSLPLLLFCFGSSFPSSWAPGLRECTCPWTCTRRSRCTQPLRQHRCPWLAWQGEGGVSDFLSHAISLSSLSVPHTCRPTLQCAS